ncbi:MAG: hypothetical protein AAGF06_00785 [Pseudomonadota bacterium]
MRFLIAISVLWSSFSFAGMYVFEPKHQLPESLVSVLHQQFGSEVRASAFSNQLIVNAPKSLDAKIKALVHRLDQPIQQLKLRVRVKDQSTRQTLGTNVTGQYCKDSICVSTGGGVNAGIYSNQSSSAHITLGDTRTQTRYQGEQEVRAMSGRPALISTGQSVPVTHYMRHSSRYPGSVHSQVNITRHVNYRDVSRGFYVTPTIQGDRVRLDINVNNDQVLKQTGGFQQPSIDVQEVSSQVEGRVNQWIPLGRQDFSDASNQRGAFNVGNAQLQRWSNYEVYVERVSIGR